MVAEKTENLKHDRYKKNTPSLLDRRVVAENYLVDPEKVPFLQGVSLFFLSSPTMVCYTPPSMAGSFKSREILLAKMGVCARY